MYVCSAYENYTLSSPTNLYYDRTQYSYTHAVDLQFTSFKSFYLTYVKTNRHET